MEKWSQLDEMTSDPVFRKFALPFDDRTDVRDATYFLRKDGSFVFAEGYYHEQDRPFSERRVVSHIVYVPGEESRKSLFSPKVIFGRPYENITKKIMTENPVEKFYPLQLARYHEIDPGLTTDKPFFGRFKAYVPQSELVAVFPQRHTLSVICGLHEENAAAARIKVVTEAMSELLSLPVGDIGISGSVSLGAYLDPHDLDYVIYGKVSEIRRITDHIYDLTRRDEDRKVTEFGKFWPLRYFEEVKGEKFMVCPFFSYLDEEETPLRIFDTSGVKRAVVRGRVCDHTHNCFNPSILELDDVTIDGKTKSGNLKLVIYHGGARGDYVEGDTIAVDAELAEVTTYRMKNGSKEVKERFEAVFVTNFDQFQAV